MASIFSKIIKGEIPAHKIAETKDFIAFLDVSPLIEGHTLVVPKIEVDYIFDIEDDLYKEYFLFAKRVAKAIEKAIPCKKIGVTVIGLEVPHSHIHLIPINNVSDMNFSLPKKAFSDEEFLKTAEKIRKFI